MKASIFDSKGAVNSLRVLGLFAGIGGIEFGLHRSGHRTVEFCEADPGAREVLEKCFPDTPIASDVTDYRNGRQVPSGVSCITAGFPCQDLSQAGKTLGLEGERSSLISEVFWLLRNRRRVEWLVLENVPFMLRLGRGRTMEVIVSNLSELGYRWAYRVVDSRAFGLPQRRRRVFLVASLSNDPRDVLLSEDAGEPEPRLADGRTAAGFYWTEGNRGLGWAVDAVPTIKGGSGVGIPSPPAIWAPGQGIFKPGLRDAERMQGFPPDWTKPAERVVMSRHRWKLIGNAVSPPAATWLGRRLSEPLPYSSENGDEGLAEGATWPDAAYDIGEGRFKADVSDYPVRRPRPSLREFVALEEAELLSLRATRGFHSRFSASTLRRPKGFMEALEEHIKRMEEVEAPV